ncbi:hypothetical protein SAMN02910377_02136 [Pseudobutyrivibrio ruminis]|uniref:Uncharacterized protein n=2 Tax=Pseudobutyrivibrio ruminis TaxID=46206 RepID=A0A1H7KV80_9FIRM|nr:hypothetical protein SAMN02910377_02136 [Pseudobutyrivibrio ruminis]
MRGWAAVRNWGYRMANHSKIRRRLIKCTLETYISIVLAVGNGMDLDSFIYVTMKK